MRRPKEHAALGIFVAEGDKVVQRLLQDPRYGIVSVVLPPDRVEEFTPLLQGRTEDFDLFVAEKKLLNTLIGFHMYQGVLAVGKIPSPPALETVLADAPRPLLLVAADDLTNSENVGVLIRNCAAFGVHGVIIGETCATPWLRPTACHRNRQPRAHAPQASCGGHPSCCRASAHRRAHAHAGQVHGRLLPCDGQRRHRHPAGSVGSV
jgi:tRNA G18 (ribose-2'-O)-methylase SpoU